jgi:hypothetical protein
MMRMIDGADPRFAKAVKIAEDKLRSSTGDYD